MSFYRGESNVPGAAGNLMAGNPFGSDFIIRQRPGQRPGQPIMPGENKQDIEKLYGAPGLIPMQLPNQPLLPQAYGYGGGMYGSSVPMGNAGFFMGPQLGQQLPEGFINKYVS